MAASRKLEIISDKFQILNKYLPRRICEDNIRMDLREIWWDGVKWMHLAQDRDQRRAGVNTVMNLQVP
jgi:hypothetical protein